MPVSMAADRPNRISRSLLRVTANKPSDLTIKILNPKEGRKKSKWEKRMCGTNRKLSKMIAITLVFCSSGQKKVGVTSEPRTFPGIKKS